MGKLRDMKCFKCNVKMIKQKAPCSGGICNKWACPNCGKKLHNFRGTPQPWPGNPPT